MDRRADLIRCFALVPEEEIHDGNRDQHGEENAHADDEQHQAVNIGGKVGGRLRIKRQLRLHGLVCSLLVQIHTCRCMFAAAKNEKGNNHGGDSHDAAETHDVKNRRAVVSRGGIILEAIQQDAIYGRTNLSGGSIHKTQAKVACRKFDSVKITGNVAIGREQEQTARVSEKIVLCIKIEMEIRSVC